MRKSALLFFCIVFAQLTLPHPVAGNEQLRVGVYDNYPMQFVANDGKVEGFLIDILEYIGSREKWKISYVPGSEKSIKLFAPPREERISLASYSRSVEKWKANYAPLI